jgi:hypothetical protein
VQFINPQEEETRVAARYQVFIILWIAMLISLGLFLGLAVFVPSSGRPDRTMSYAFFGISLILVIASFLIKHRQVKQALEKQQVPILLSAYIVSFALCEAAGLFGLLDHFVTGSKNYRFMFALAVFGMLVHFPKKDHVRSVSYKQL